jgi:hypothetical protein
MVNGDNRSTSLKKEIVLMGWNMLPRERDVKKKSCQIAHRGNYKIRNMSVRGRHTLRNLQGTHLAQSLLSSGQGPFPRFVKLLWATKVRH